MALERNGHNFDGASPFASAQEFKFWSPFIDKVLVEKEIVPDSPDYHVLINAIASFARSMPNGVRVGNFLMLSFQRHFAKVRAQMMREASLKR